MTKTIHLFAGYSVFVTNSKKQYNRHIDKLVSDEKNSRYMLPEHLTFLNGRAFESNGPDGYYLAIFIKKSSKVKTAIHEAVHIVEYLMEHVNISDDEFKADLIGHLGMECLCFCEGH